MVVISCDGHIITVADPGFHVRRGDFMEKMSVKLNLDHCIGGAMRRAPPLDLPNCTKYISCKYVTFNNSRRYM